MFFLSIRRAKMIIVLAKEPTKPTSFNDAFDLLTSTTRCSLTSNSGQDSSVPALQQRHHVCSATSGILGKRWYLLGYQWRLC
jgi:hypothetical protein